MNWKRVWSFALLIGLALAACARGFAAEIPPDKGIPEDGGALGLPCRAYLLMSSDTGEVLCAHRGLEEMPMASITKVMTLLLTFEALDAGQVQPEDIVPVTEHAFSMGGSQIWLEPGEQLTLHEMLKAICVSSANDAAVAVAEYIGGSEPAFVERMNARAAELGMEHTCFKNACGLDEAGHYSCAADVGVMSLALMQHPEIFEYTGIWTDTLRGGKTQLTNTNKLLRSYPGITGLKTGTTSGAGVCITATARRDGTGLIAVILGSPSGKERFAAATALLDHGFASYECAALPPSGLPESIPVHGGCAEEAALQCGIPEKIVVKKGTAGRLRTELQLQQALEAPVAAGQQAGEIRLYCEEELLHTYPVITADKTDKMSRNYAMRLLWDALLQL